MNELTIRIYEGCDEVGFFYDIYDCDISGVDDIDEVESIDGGFCTTTIENALSMATKQAKEIIKRSK